LLAVDVGTGGVELGVACGYEFLEDGVVGVEGGDAGAGVGVGAGRESVVGKTGTDEDRY